MQKTKGSFSFIKLFLYLVLAAFFVVFCVFALGAAVVLGVVFLLFLLVRRTKNKNSHSAPSVTLALQGPPVTMSPEEYSQMRRMEIDELERNYDLNTLEGIASIPVPSKKQKRGTSYSMTGQIEYYLSHIKGGAYQTNNQVELALACYKKANELMPFAVTSYPASEYMKYVNLLKKVRRFDEARAEQAKIDTRFELLDAELEEKWLPENRLREQADILYGSDLIETSFRLAVCPECAKFRNRRYSMYGRDPRYPRYPEFLKNNPLHCNLLCYPVIHGVQTMYDYNNVPIDPIAHSNRPFIDDRTQEEKDNYALAQEKERTDSQREADRRDYDWLWEHMPEICPKSFSSYRKIKKSNSDNFQKIYEAVQGSGYKLSAK